MFLTIRVYDNENDDRLNRANCVPSFLTVNHPFNECDTELVVENQLRRFKIDTMFDFVGLVFCLIPFKSHLY